MWANLPRGMWAAGSAASSHILAVRLFARVAANGLKIGDVISLEDRVLQVRHAKHVKPGKGVAYVSCELSCLREGVKLNRRLRAAESVEKVRLDNEPFTLLYVDPDTGRYVVMHRESFEQMELEGGAVEASQKPFLQDGMDLDVSLLQGTGEPLAVSLPKEVELEVVSEGQIMGGAGPVTKLVTLSNGVEVKTPGFISAGENIVVSTRDGSYVRRA